MNISFRVRVQTLAAIGVGASVLFNPAAAAAQQSVPHLESCTQNGWGFLDRLEFRFGTVNACDKPVTIWFMAKDHHVFRRTVEPGRLFRTDIAERRVVERGWMFATCPEGYEPDVAFSEENWTAITESKYACIKN